MTDPFPEGGIILSLLGADTCRKGNNYFYSQFTFKVHRNVAT